MDGKDERGYRIGVEEASGGFPEVAPSLQASQAIGDPADQVAYVVAGTLKAQRGKGGGGIGPEETLVAETLREHPRPGSNSNGQIVAAPLTKGSAAGEGVSEPGRRQEDDTNIVAFSWQQGDDSKWNPDGRGRSWVHRAGDYAAGLSASGRHDAISGESVGVRRLTPTECERLQGFPDNWTQLGETPDSRRYSALGDAVTVNVSEWIGRRLGT